MELYFDKFNNVIPNKCVLSVHETIQGHPDSSHSWALHLDKILRQRIGLKPTTLEGCLYSGKYIKTMYTLPLVGG